MCTPSRGRSVSLTLLPLLALFMVSCSRGTTEQEEETAVRPAKLVVVGMAASERLNRYPAVIAASKLSELSFEVGGSIRELSVTEAKQVEAGEVIAKLDQRDFRSKLTAAQSQFDKAESDYQRAARLAEQDAIAVSELEQRKSQMDTARAQLDEAEKALGDTELRAPFPGVISKVEVEQHQTIQGGQVVASMFDGNAMEAVINVPASIIAESRKQTNTTASVVFDAAPGIPVAATFKEASLEADPVSQTYEVTFSFTPPEDLVTLPGMNATVVLSTPSAQTAPGEEFVRVPLGAVLSDGERQYVWVVDNETMAVSKRLITIKDGLGENVTVTEGLAAGDTIVGAGASYLSEGMVVRPWNE